MSKIDRCSDDRCKLSEKGFKRFLSILRFISPGTQMSVLEMEKVELENRLKLINNILENIQNGRNLGENDEKA